MTLTEIFKTNCRATTTLLNEKPSLSFKDLVSGFGGKNKNGIIARFSFDNFFIDLYFIESGPLAYAPNTIWINVGFESVSFLPFAVYDILAVAEPENFKCYTYPYLYTEEIMIQAFGEINDLFKRLIPKLQEFSETGTIKNNLILNQQETINKFVNDDIFKREIEMLDASLKIRDMLIRNFQESVISHVILGGVSDFFNNEHEKAIKKLSKAKYLTFYESRLFEKLKNGDLEGFDASPFREAKYKDYTKVAKKRTYSLGTKGLFKFIIPTILTTPLFFIIFLFTYIFLCYLKFNDTMLFMNSSLYSMVTLLLAAFLAGEGFSFHFSHKIRNPFKKKKKDEKEGITEFKRRSKILKYITILIETVIIILLFSTVNNTIAFTENKVLYPEDSAIVLKQEALRYEYLDSVYKAEGYYLYGIKYFELEHYILITKSGNMIDLAVYPESCTKEFETEILPLLIEKGVEVKYTKSEKDIVK